MIQRSGALLAVLLLLFATACTAGGSATEVDPSSPPPPAQETASPGPAAPATASPGPAAPATPGAPSTPVLPAPSVTADPRSVLPGENFPGPLSGATLAVVGVAADDVLNVRNVPGTGGEVFAEFPPLADDVVASGRGRQVDDGIWFEVEGGAADDGWVNARFLAYLGETTDITSELSSMPSAETMVQLVDKFMSGYLPEFDADVELRTVIVNGPTVGDLGEVTVDVLGYPDDAAIGERLHLFAEPNSGGENFTLRTVEHTQICGRGVSDGLCV